MEGSEQIMSTLITEDKGVLEDTATIDLLYTCPLFLGIFKTRTGYFKHLTNVEHDFKLESEERDIQFRNKMRATSFSKQSWCKEGDIEYIRSLSSRPATSHKTLEYFCRMFDPVEKDHKEAVEILRSVRVPIRHKTQDESEDAIEMFCL